MTSSQKLLKIMSFASLAMCVALAVLCSMSLSFANTSTGLLQALLIGVAAVIDAVIGVMGIGAANRPSRASGIFVVASLAAVLNIVFAVVLVMLPGLWAGNVVNCVVVCVYWHFVRIVRMQSLQ